MIDKMKKKYFKHLLIQQLNAASEVRKSSLRGLNDSKNDYTDFVDQASNETDTDYALHIREREGRLITKIKEALERLEQGTYGICEECDEEISEARLEARAVAILCIACKKREEAAEKLRGI